MHRQCILHLRPVESGVSHGWVSGVVFTCMAWSGDMEAVALHDFNTHAWNIHNYYVYSRFMAPFITNLRKHKALYMDRLKFHTGQVKVSPNQLAHEGSKEEVHVRGVNLYGTLQHGNGKIVPYVVSACLKVLYIHVLLRCIFNNFQGQ